MNLLGVLRPKGARQIFLVAFLVIPASSRLAARAHERTREQSVFAMEGEPVERPAKLPDSALKIMRENAFVLSCLETGNSAEDITEEWFVASEIHLSNKKQADLVVMPSETSVSACLLHAHSMPFWILVRNQKGYALALEEHVQVLRVLSSVSNGYRDIETQLSNLNESTTWVFKFDGDKYVLKQKASIPR